MPIHNQIGSVVSLARVVLAGVDPAREHTPVQTESLKLLLNTLIELASPAHHAVAGETARRTVESMIAPPILAGGADGR